MSALDILGIILIVLIGTIFLLMTLLPLFADKHYGD